ncbi:MAG: hypothetical protein HQL65_03450 [Magnetococcales bacterium]|nr:hypothetical protein [Magnetococcales bacterium]
MRIWVALSGLLCLLSWGDVQADTIEALLQGFYGPDGIANKAEVYTGEMTRCCLQRTTVGEQSPREARIQSRSLFRNAEHAVYATTMRAGNHVRDWYSFLRYEQGVWKLGAVRCLALYGPFWIVLQELEGKQHRSDDEEWRYQNMRLTALGDVELADYFKSNKERLTDLANHAMARQTAAVTRMARQLFLTSAKLDLDAGWVEITIGGILDNSVGFLFVPDGKQPPAMTPDAYIMVERLAGNWYLFKTT